MDRQTLQNMMQDPAVFRQYLLIDTDDGPRALAKVMDPWQREDFEALDPAWRRVVGQTVEGGKQLAYLERPRGHSKTSDLAVMSLWTLLVSRRRLSGVAAAADRDQARLIRDAIGRIVSQNRWLAVETPDREDFGKRKPLIDVQSYRVRNTATGSVLEILSGDVGSSWGITPHFLLTDELVNWGDGSGEQLWGSLLSSTAKRRDCLLIVISNAGYGRGRSWQWKIRETARTDPTWYFHRLDGPQASWITADRLEQQQHMLPPSVFERVWLNRWTTGSGDALREEDIYACIDPNRKPMDYREYPSGLGAGLDLSATRDWAAFVGVGFNFPNRRPYLAWVESWKPPILFEEVYQTILAYRDRFGLRYICFDPWQCLSIAERLATEGMTMVPITPTGQNCTVMATCLLETFRDRRIDLYPDELLTNDLLNLTLAERSYGYKLEPSRDATGHGDRGQALALILPHITELATTAPAPLNGPPDALGNNLLSYIHKQQARDGFREHFGIRG